MNRFLCIEIVGESSFHKYLFQSGWSGKDYGFYFNQATGSHLRAYRDLEHYLAERVDLHKSATVWPLLANLLPADLIDPKAFVDGEPAASTPPARSRTTKPSRA